MLEKFQSLLKNFDLDSSKKLGKCSYGQRKKFLIAFLLSTGCKLMLLDEPTNGLDIPSKSIFRRMVAAPTYRPNGDNQHPPGKRCGKPG
jgi:ABC-2 type transport system ATP-binding protein